MMLSAARRLSLWVPPLLYMAVIFYTSSQSEPLPALTAVVWDKLIHTAEYAALAFLFCRAARGEGAGWFGAIALAIVLTSTYGATDEWHQSFVPERDSDVHDWYADTTGAAAGSAIYGGVSMALRRPRPLRR